MTLTTGAKETLGRVKARAKTLLREIGPLALRIATRGALSGEDVKHYAEIISSSGDEIAEAASKYAEEALERHRKAKETTATP